MSGYYCMLMLYHSFLIMQKGAWGRRLHNISTKELCFVIYSMTLTMGSVTICSILAQHEFDGYKVTSTDLLVHDITMIFYAVSRVVPSVMTVSSVARVDTHPFTATYACRGSHPTSPPHTHTHIPMQVIATSLPVRVARMEGGRAQGMVRPRPPPLCTSLSCRLDDDDIVVGRRLVPPPGPHTYTLHTPARVPLPSMQLTPSRPPPSSVVVHPTPAPTPT